MLGVSKELRDCCIVLLHPGFLPFPYFLQHGTPFFCSVAVDQIFFMLSSRQKQKGVFECGDTLFYMPLKLVIEGLLVCTVKILWQGLICVSVK